MRKSFRKKAAAVMMAAAVLFTSVQTELAVYAKGPTYTAMQDVYYTKDNCVVYAEPSYESTVLTTIGANVPVRVIGMYSNGWYRINLGVIAYVKMDSVTSAGAIGIKKNDDRQVADAQRTAAELGYEFVYLTLNKKKEIKKDIYNSYVGKKVMLYAKINDELGVSFKMLYEDPVKKDIDLNVTKYEFTSQWSPSAPPVPTPPPVSGSSRVVYYQFQNPIELKGQLAIFQFKTGYDKIVEIFPYDVEYTDSYEHMNNYWTEFSEFAYAPVTQVASIAIVETETASSLVPDERDIMSDFRKGIKYQSDDDKAYRNNIVHGKLRKDTEYVDYEY